MYTSFDWKSHLAIILENFSCQTGTIHRTTGEQMLSLIEQIGVPEFLIEKISTIPFGKGIAGAAALSREPIELCNLQQDLGGVAKPEARKTGVAGSLAVPIFSKDQSEVIGTLGIGKIVPYEFSDFEKEQLMAAAAVIAQLFEQNQARQD
jgi:L-methionine (R)-S-oxide reductase